MSHRVDFAAIKRSVPLAPVLERYHVKLRLSGRDQYRGDRASGALGHKPGRPECERVLGVVRVRCQVKEVDRAVSQEQYPRDNPERNGHGHHLPRRVRIVTYQRGPGRGGPQGDRHPRVGRSALERGALTK